MLHPFPESESELVAMNTLLCILILLLLKFPKAVKILLVAFFVERKGKASYRHLSRGSVSSSSVLIYMNLFYRVIIASFTSSACLKPELNRSMKNCINGAIVKIRKKEKTKYQNLLERLTRKLEKPACRSMQTKDRNAVNQIIKCTT